MSYDYEDLDGPLQNQLIPDIQEMIDAGEYDKAEDMITEQMEEDPENIALHRMLLNVMDLKETIPSFPENSSATKRLKKRFLQLVKSSNVELSHIDQVKYTEMLFNKYFYFVEYPDETILERLVEQIPDFNLFKNN